MAKFVSSFYVLIYLLLENLNSNMAFSVTQSYNVYKYLIAKIEFPPIKVTKYLNFLRMDVNYIMLFKHYYHIQQINYFRSCI